MTLLLHTSWIDFLKEELKAPYMTQLFNFLNDESKSHTIYPPGPLTFNAFNFIKPEEVKVVLVGQDPYHGRGQAHGLSFSVPPGIATPPSLRNIYEELKNDLGVELPDGNLESWAQQGVLLLNRTLTVRADHARSHSSRGWELFTGQVLAKLSKDFQHLVFLLWGGDAAQAAIYVDEKKHLILQAPHPSPLSAYRGFFGCKHFSKSNNWLEAHGRKPIEWGKVAAGDEKSRQPSS